MTADPEVLGGARDGWFVRAAGAVADLGNPFYREERQRDVWNEASAVGLQLTLWLGMAAATAMVWLGGAPALPYVVAFLGVLSLASFVSLLYARSLGVTDPGRVLRLRMLPLAVLLTLLAVGLERAAPQGSFGEGFGRGLLVGAAGAALALLWRGLRARRERPESARH
jgi:hypothetical protein